MTFLTLFPGCQWWGGESETYRNSDAFPLDAIKGFGGYGLGRFENRDRVGAGSISDAMGQCYVLKLGIRYNHAVDNSLWQQGHGFSLYLHTICFDEEPTVHSFLYGLLWHQCHNLRGFKIWDRKGQAFCNP